MKFVKELFARLVALAKSEPAVVVSGVLAVAGDAAVTFGFTLTQKETFAIQGVVVLVLSLVTRHFVTPFVAAKNK